MIVKTRLLAFKKDKIFVLKKNSPKTKYTFAGGTVKKNETKNNGFIREVFEETGVTLSKKDIHYYTSFLVVKAKNILVEKHYYIVDKSAIKKYSNLESNKFTRVCWLPIYEVIPFLDKTDKKAVLEYLERKVLFQ